jgi:spoIIIJ-associated protein
MQQRIFYFMPIIFLVFCYNYASGLALYWTTQNLFSIVQLYLTRNKPLPTLEKKSIVAKLAMNPQPAEILDTILGYLGFVATIELEEHEGTPILQILTHEPQRLIGRREEVMEDLQHLVNRLLLAQNPPAPRVIVDVQHHRAMRDDALVSKVKQLANVVRATGRPMQTLPLNSYDRRIVHNLFKDDSEIQTWSPPEEDRLKRITIRKRPAGK